MDNTSQVRDKIRWHQREQSTVLRVQDNERVYSVFCIFHVSVVTYWPFHSKTKWNITITPFVSIASINILTEMPKMTTAKLQWTNKCKQGHSLLLPLWIFIPLRFLVCKTSPKPRKISFASHGWVYEPNRAAEHFWTICSWPHDKREDTIVKNQLKFDERLFPDSSRLILNLKSPNESACFRPD